jgi:hypothetical protein
MAILSWTGFLISSVDQAMKDFAERGLQDIAHDGLEEMRQSEDFHLTRLANIWLVCPWG